MSEAIRLVVFTSALSYSVRKGIVDIDESVPGLEWLVLWHAPRKSPAQLLRSQRLNIKRNGWRWIPYQAQDIVQRLWPARSGRTPAAAPGLGLEQAALEARPNLRLLRVPDLHADEVVEQLRRYAPRLGLSLAAPILKRSIFGVPALGTLNLHKGKVPEFRGMPPAFWEMWTGQSSVGCTVHWVDDKLDTGHIVAESSLAVARHSTVKGLQLGLDELGCELMRKAVADVLAGRADARAQPTHAAATYRKPTLQQQSEMAKRERTREPAAGSPLKPALKGMAHAGVNALIRPLGRVRAPRITVLLYHRVSDEARDNLTVGVAQFDRQMAALRRHCDLLSIEEVLAMDRVPRSARPQVAVTFDDGYLDNYMHAAPILRRHGVPAAFFVSTGIVDSHNRFPHDVRRGNDWIPVMDWQQLRLMRRWGFTIGSHTVSHIDIAAEPPEVVRRELAASKVDLRRELDLNDTILAYPYGGRQHMTPERLGWVREAGYAGCLSAYGGSNVGQVDRFNVLRRGIHWEFSDRALLVQTLGL